MAIKALKTNQSKGWGGVKQRGVMRKGSQRGPGLGGDLRDEKGPVTQRSRGRTLQAEERVNKRVHKSPVVGAEGARRRGGGAEVRLVGQARWHRALPPRSGM